MALGAVIITLLFSLASLIAIYFMFIAMRRPRVATYDLPSPLRRRVWVAAFAGIVFVALSVFSLVSHSDGHHGWVLIPGVPTFLLFFAPMFTCLAIMLRAQNEGRNVQP